jgi:hypothetical protein
MFSKWTSTSNKLSLLFPYIHYTPSPSSMKNLAFICAAIIAVSCSNPSPNMKGAYKMLSQNLKGDTLDITNNNSQLKLYTEEYMMWTNYSPADSGRGFGICAYITNEDEVIESAIYSAANETVSDSTQNYSLTIERTGKGYRQAISSMERGTGARFVSTEEYETVGAAKTSPLDGAWVMTDGFYTNDKGENVPVKATIYRAYYAGNFMFGNTMRDALNVSQANIGFGTFEMNGDSALTESIQTSSYANLVGRKFPITLKWNGPDEFTQTIMAEDGSSSETETYKRLGK